METIRFVTDLFVTGEMLQNEIGNAGNRIWSLGQIVSTEARMIDGDQLPPLAQSIALQIPLGIAAHETMDKNEWFHLRPP